MTVALWSEKREEVLGEEFPCGSLVESLRRTIKYVGNSGFIASMPQLLQEFPSHRFYTAFSEEDIVIDEEGRFERKGQQVVVTSHGKIILGTPNRLDEALRTSTNIYGKLALGEATNLLEGRIGREAINIWHYEDFVKLDSLPESYSVVRPLSLARQTNASQRGKSAWQDVSDLCDKEGKVTDSQVIVCAGGMKAAQRVIEIAKQKLKGKLGVWQYLDHILPPQGRLLFLGYCDGCEGYFFGDYCGFVAGNSLWYDDFTSDISCFVGHRSAQIKNPNRSKQRGIRPRKEIKRNS